MLFYDVETTLTRLIKLQYKRITNMAGFVTSYEVYLMQQLFHIKVYVLMFNRLLPSRKIKYIKIMNASGGFVLSKLQTFI